MKFRYWLTAKQNPFRADGTTKNVSESQRVFIIHGEVGIPQDIQRALDIAITASHKDYNHFQLILERVPSEAAHVG